MKSMSILRGARGNMEGIYSYKITFQMFGLYCPNLHYFPLLPYGRKYPAPLKHIYLYIYMQYEL